MRIYTRLLFCVLAFFPVAAIAQEHPNSLDFDGVDDYVELNSLANDLDGSTTFTVEFWMIADKNAQTSAIRVDMFAVNEPPFIGDNTLLLSMGGMNAQDGKLIVFDGVTGFDIVSTTIVGDNVCHHIAYVRNGSLGTLYIDGVQEATHTADYSFGPNNRYSLGQEWDNATPSDFYNGKLDELRVWSVARSQSDIASTMNSELQGTEPGLIAYYSFNQGFGNGSNPTVTTLNDLTVNANSGTLLNFALNGTSSNWTPFCMVFSSTIGIDAYGMSASFGLFPVPATDQLTVRGNFDRPTRVEICDVSGRLLQEAMVGENGGTLDISKLAGGIYFIRAGTLMARFQKS